jgi:hypothetical protein
MAQSRIETSTATAAAAPITPLQGQYRITAREARYPRRLCRHQPRRRPPRRLTAYPSANSIKRLRALYAEKRFCNNKQLSGTCENDDCKYEHNPIAEELKPALECLARLVPCSKHGGRRKANCVYGHVCQKADCRHRGSKNYCRFPSGVCLEEYSVSDYVPANDSPMLPPSVDSKDAQNAANGGTSLLC